MTRCLQPWASGSLMVDIDAAVTQSRASPKSNPSPSLARAPTPTSFWAPVFLQGKTRWVSARWDSMPPPSSAPPPVAVFLIFPLGHLRRGASSLRIEIGSLRRSANLSALLRLSHIALHPHWHNQPLPGTTSHTVQSRTLFEPLCWVSILGKRHSAQLDLNQVPSCLSAPSLAFESIFAPSDISETLEPSPSATYPRLTPSLHIMGLLSLTYRRPTYVERPPSMDGDQVSIGSGSADGEQLGSVKSSTSSTIAGIPAALSFDRIIDGGTCPVSNGSNPPCQTAY